jgi:hypothetical protein
VKKEKENRGVAAGGATNYFIGESGSLWQAAAILPPLFRSNGAQFRLITQSRDFYVLWCVFLVFAHHLA